ncbi:RNase HI [Mariprofundus ferrinatatus]|uniref:Ribonuclease H n=1 Tax=Mariprofundus ferrinatatus TaxID=1921087 RepID=A0A2K8L674_9PROT|nr:ribonuclease HI [Mariprofundus ferrinatatus]ATX82743.1 RNase HI [Mariprofundus ferrinatatus]
MRKPVVEAYTDGACSGNPGPGGWGVLLRMGKHEKELKGGEAATTNQQMELQAAVEALKALTKPCRITIHSDSKYVVQGMNEWIHNWKKKGWKTAGKKPVSNLERWQELDTLAAKHEVTWQWVKGHSGHPENERADELARQGIPVG